MNIRAVFEDLPHRACTGRVGCLCLVLSFQVSWGEICQAQAKDYTVVQVGHQYIGGLVTRRSHTVLYHQYAVLLVETVLG